MTVLSARNFVVIVLGVAVSPALCAGSRALFFCIVMMSAWEFGLDGSPLRTERANKHLLSMQGLHVIDADTFGRNDCLIDSIMQSLLHSGFLRSSVTLDVRDEIASSVRQHLQDNGLTRNDDFDYLRHDVHVQPIIDFLLSRCESIWSDLDNAQCFGFTVIVYDRFQNRALQSIQGDVIGELPETEPVRVLPKLQFIAEHEPVFIQILLYANTHRDGTGWHYEWIQPQAIAPDNSISATVSMPSDIPEALGLGVKSSCSDHASYMSQQQINAVQKDIWEAATLDSNTSGSHGASSSGQTGTLDPAIVNQVNMDVDIFEALGLGVKSSFSDPLDSLIMQHSQHHQSHSVQMEDGSNLDSQSDSSDSSSSESSGCEELYFQVSADESFCAASSTEQDIVQNRCLQLRAFMRERPCLPLRSDGQALTSSDLASGIRLPLYSCPWRDCHFCSDIGGKSYYDRWILPQLKLNDGIGNFGGRPVGNCPEFMPWDACLNQDLHESVRRHCVLSRATLKRQNKKDDQRRFSMATPELGSRTYRRILDPQSGVAPSAKRIVQDIAGVFRAMEIVQKARGVYVEGLAERTGRRYQKNNGHGGPRKKGDHSIAYLKKTTLLHPDLREMRKEERAARERRRIDLL